MATRFLTVGDLMLDVAVSGAGHDASVIVRPGGSAANAAVWGAVSSRPGVVVCPAVEHSSVRDASLRAGQVAWVGVDAVGIEATMRDHPGSPAQWW